MHENRGPSQNLDDLIDQDISSYEYYQSLSEDTKKRLQIFDPTSFEELQAFAADMRNRNGPAY